MPKCILLEQNDKTQNIDFSLQNINIEVLPNKINYIEGETFDPTGMIVTASYGTTEVILSTVEITNYTILQPEVLTTKTEQIIVSYSELGKTCKTSLSIQVVPKTYIEIVQMPNKLVYEYGDILDTTGMILIIKGEGIALDILKEVTFSPTVMSNIGTQEILITLNSERWGFKTASFTVTVNRKKIPYPSWKNNNQFTYNGTIQTATFSNYWNNYNKDFISLIEINSTLSASEAGNYIIYFEPKTNYCWNTGTIEAYAASWTIQKASRTLTANPNNIILNEDNYTNGVTINLSYVGAGAISCYSNNQNISILINENNKTVTVKSTNKIQSGFENLTISIGEYGNYLYSSTVVTINYNYWSWGNDGEIADTEWFIGLKNYLQDNEPLSDWIGTTKIITLSKPVLGTTEHSITCIGINDDADKTVTWIVTNALEQKTSYSTQNSEYWTDADVIQAVLNNYYDYCPAKNAIKIVSKGVTISGVGEAEEIQYYEMPVFLISYYELVGETNRSRGEECTENRRKFTYEFFTGENLTIDAEDQDSWYWTRSISSSRVNQICSIRIGSNSLNFSASSSGEGYLRPAFVIGN